jgi:hypothetical protein
MFGMFNLSLSALVSYIVDVVTCLCFSYLYTDCIDEQQAYALVYCSVDVIPLSALISFIVDAVAGLGFKFLYYRCITAVCICFLHCRCTVAADLCFRFLYDRCITAACALVSYTVDVVADLLYVLDSFVTQVQ